MKNDVSYALSIVLGAILGYLLRYEIDAVLFFFFGVHTSSIPMC